MADVAENPRWANYCRAHGRTSEEQLAIDAERYPGGKMVGFLLWHKARLVEGSHAIPQAFFKGGLIDHEAYDAWLTTWVDNYLQEPTYDGA